ncbi:hypothetical protein GPUN_2162 [Glaciecola punicea ACAM 611]|uniref:Uncharacterized protein n=1 Tax=Glaciecola punicea ACAM 611 TaxID=1121923 RepID=H5TDA0_9ALTE|nr:hypothetical protein GPUN_2162 [Glaciecola punicea ACAM 611]
MLTKLNDTMVSNIKINIFTAKIAYIVGLLQDIRILHVELCYCL